MIKKFESFNPIEDCKIITFDEKMKLDMLSVDWDQNELEKIKRLFKIDAPESNEFIFINSDIAYPLVIKVVYDYKFSMRASIHKLNDSYYTISYSEENSLEIGKNKSYYKCDQIYGLKSFARFFKSRFNHLKNLDYSSVDTTEPMYKIVQN